MIQSQWNFSFGMRVDWFATQITTAGVGSVLLFGMLVCSSRLAAAELTAAARGFETLRTHQYLPPDFDDEVFAALWTVWPEPDRTDAEKGDPKARRRMMFSYYGLIQAPDDIHETQPAMGYVSDGQGQWVMNCLACHGGKVAGKAIPGLPNSHTALQTLAEDVRSGEVDAEEIFVSSGSRLSANAAKHHERHHKFRHFRDCPGCLSQPGYVGRSAQKNACITASRYGRTAILECP